MNRDPSISSAQGPRQALDSQRQASSIKHVLQEASAQLRPVTDAPRLEAEVLLTHLLGLSRTTLLAHSERLLTTAQQDRYEELVSVRAADHPLPYITGSVEFHGLEFEVTPEVSIPRPETETLVDLALESRPSAIVDVGTGSGCIAIALAVRLPEATVYGIDISPAAVAVARRNVERHALDERVRMLIGDVLARRPPPVDLIVSNPPYVSTAEWASLPASIRHHEPRLALDGGPNGLTVIRRLMAQSQGMLREDGRLLVEIGANQGEAVIHLAQTFFPQDQVSISIHQDLAGRDRVLEVQT